MTTKKHNYNIKIAWSTEFDGNVDDSFEIKAKNFDELLKELEKNHLNIKIKDFDEQDGDFETYAILCKTYIADQEGNEYTPEEFFKKYPELEDDDEKREELPYISRYVDIYRED